MSTKKKKKKKSATMKFLDELTGGPLSIGDAVNAARLSAELSQAELGERVGVSRSYICDLEKGRKPISPRKAAAIAKALGMVEAVFVKLAIQDTVDRSGLNYTVSVEAA